MKGRWLVFILIVVIGVGLAAVRGADGTTLTIPAVDVEAGTSQTYEIAINCLEDGCIAFDITLRFDPALVQIDEVRIGPYLGENAIEVDSNINNEAGTVRLAAVALGQLPPPQDNILLRLDFTPLGSGKVEFTVDHLDMSDRQGLPIAVEIVDVIQPTTVPPVAETCEYTVRTGDTMTGIALANDVTIDAIMTLNNISDARFIYVGQKLQIPTSDCHAGVGPGGGSGQTRPGNKRYFEVWDCRHLGSNVFEWYGVERTYDSAGNAVSEQRVDGPHSGEWRDGCPQGEPPPGGGGSDGGGDDAGGGGSTPGGGGTIPA